MTIDMSESGWVPDLSAFGARLAVVRHQMKWNAAEAALACGVSKGSWRDWELHDRLPRDFPSVASAIAKATGCDEYWLMTGRSSYTPPSPDGGDESLLSGLNRRPSAYKVPGVASIICFPTPSETDEPPLRRVA